MWFILWGPWLCAENLRVFHQTLLSYFNLDQSGPQSHAAKMAKNFKKYSAKFV